MGLHAHLLRERLRFEYLEREPFCYPIPSREEPAERIEDFRKFCQVDLMLRRRVLVISDGIVFVGAAHRGRPIWEPKEGLFDSGFHETDAEEISA